MACPWTSFFRAGGWNEVRRSSKVVSGGFGCVEKGKRDTRVMHACIIAGHMLCYELSVTGIAQKGLVILPCFYSLSFRQK